MNDENLDQALNSVRETYRVPPEPPLEQMWAAIDERMLASPGRWTLQRRGTPWSIIGLAAAASLVIGVSVGRWSAPEPTQAADTVVVTTEAPVDAQLVSDIAPPLHRRATNYLGEMEALLRNVQDDPDGAYTARAVALLGQTRLLMDSPAGSTARMQALFEDLELILSQIAMLRQDGSKTRRTQDVEMIRNVLAEREMVLRVRTAVVALASSDED